MDEDDEVEVPPLNKAQLAGWYQQGPTPGRWAVLDPPGRGGPLAAAPPRRPDHPHRTGEAPAPTSATRQADGWAGVYAAPSKAAALRLIILQEPGVVVGCGGGTSVRWP